MTFLGKVLIVVQVVLSLCFMAFAGAVFAVHQNWRAEYNTAQSAIQNLQGENNNLRDAHDSELDQLQIEIDAANEEMRQFQLAATASEQQLQASIRDNQNLSQEIRRLEGEVEAAGMEAAFRLEEAQEQRAENRAQQTALDATQTELRNANDQIFALGVELADLQRRFTALQEDNAHQLALLRQNGIDPATERLLGGVLAPPPRLTGASSKFNSTMPAARKWSCSHWAKTMAWLSGMSSTSIASLMAKRSISDKFVSPANPSQTEWWPKCSPITATESSR